MGNTSKTRLWKTALAVLAVLTAAALGLGFFWPFGKRPETLRLPGVVEIQEVHLGSKVGGRVEEIFTFEGQRVPAGKLLVVFAEPELKAQVAQQKARVKQMEAELEKARNGPRPQEIRQAEADLRSAEADEKLAAQNYQRARDLYATNALGRADYDAALGALNAARAKSASLRARVDLMHAGTREEDKAEAEGRLVEARGRLRELEANLKEANVVAPEDAVVDVLAVRKGDIIPANQPVVRVLRDGDLWVKAYVPETQLGKVRLDQKVDVTIDSYPGRRFQGTITYIAGEAEFTPRNVQSLEERQHQVFAIKVTIPQPADPKERVFKSGMSAEVFIPLQEAP
jgi:multidrug resistance efflux pump